MAPDVHIPDGKDAVKLASDLAHTAPHWFALLMVVGAFLIYLERHDQSVSRMSASKDILAVQRIEQCHRVQERGYDSMERLNATMDLQVQTFRDLSKVIEHHNSLTH